MQEDRGLELDIGMTYLIKEAKPYLSAKLFQAIVGSKIPGLIVTRLHPKKMEEEYDINFDNVKSIWLSRAEGEHNMDPTRIGPLAMEIEKFIEKGGGSILLEGVEYLVLVNGFDTVHRFIEYIHEKIMTSASVLIVSISPKAFDQKQLALLERNKEVIDMPLITFSEKEKDAIKISHDR